MPAADRSFCRPPARRTAVSTGAATESARGSGDQPRQTDNRPPGKRGRFKLHLGTLLAFALLTAPLAAAPDPALVARPLAPASGPRGATLFAPVDAAQSGVHAPNTYADPRMWWELHQEFKFGAIGSGVAIGDIDQDGRPDLLVVSKVEGPRLFRNLGGWRFEDITASAFGPGSTSWWDQGLAWVRRTLGRDAPAAAAAGPWHQGVAMADINNDGWLDIYVCRFGAPNLLYVNQGNGTFREEAAARGLAITDASSMAAFGDFDRDGWLDVYLQTNLLDVLASPTGQPDYLFRNNGDGTFTDVTAAAGISGRTQGHSVTWWDYDGDGWPDLYVANDFAPADQLYRNHGDGTFRNVLDEAVPQLPHSAMGADLGDVNNDGWLDLLVADMAATSHVKDHRGMARIRALLMDVPEDPGAAAQFMRNALLLGTGTPHLREGAALAGLDATDWTWSVRFEDLDNDGWIDAHFTNGMVRELHNVDLVQRSSAAESIAEGVRLLQSSPLLAERNLAFRNAGAEAELQFEDVSAAWGLDHRGVSFGAAFGDLDGDGDLDLVHTNYEQGVTLLRNDSDRGHRLIVALRGTASNRWGVGATVRIETAAGIQVRTLVLARGYLSSSEPVLHFGLGEADRVHRLTVEWPSGYTQVLEDLPVDHHLTITEPARAGDGSAMDGLKRSASEPTGRMPVPLKAPTATQFTEISAPAGLARTVRTPSAEGTLPQPLLPQGFNRRGPALAAGDLNGDGLDDLVLGGSTLEPAQVLWREAGAEVRYRAQSLAATPGAVNDGPILILDLNGDGHADLVLTKGGANRPAHSPDYQPTVWLGDGAGGFRPAPPSTLPELPISVGAAAAADFDRDGRIDLFLGGRLLPGAYPRTPRSALLAHRGGRYEDVTDTVAPGLRDVGLVTAALWTDVDDDGWLDLLLALDWGGIRFWRNEDGRGFVDRSEAAGFAAAGSGWWTSLAAGDFNGDGRLDYVAGNLGLNTPYRASPDQPTLLFEVAATGGRPPLLVEAYHEGDRLYPRRNRNQFGSHLPTVLRRFPRHDLFAQATVAEVVGEEPLAAATRWAATELRSGVFLSQPDGPHRFVPLPRWAQISPVQGTVVADFDGDGQTDVYVVQNSHAPDAFIGRFTGGLSQLLRGDGLGGFTAIPPAESGLIVPGDAKALVTVDLQGDGWPDVIATRQQAMMRAFRNAGSTDGRPLAVRLRGRPGNPTAIGAKVTIILTDGRRQVAEVAAGSGYLSQSAPTLFFGAPADNPPKRIQVRWPSGMTTEHAPIPGETNVSLTAPPP
jgi:enediyne biosynthesis protein E4